jgi:hypothetical protein
MTGFVLLFRQSIDSEVFSDPYLWHLFSWCLLKANYKTKTYRGELVPRGSFVCGRHSASEQLGIAGGTWYDRMKKLEAMGCVSIKSNSRFTVITVEKYEQYQAGDGTANNEPTTNQQPSDNEPTTNQQPTNNQPTQEKQGNKGTRKEGNKRRSVFRKPTSKQVVKFSQLNNLDIEVDAFMDHYNSNGWKVGRNPMKCWKACVRNWCRRDRKQGTTKNTPKTFQKQKQENTENATSVVAPAIKAGMTFDDVYDMKRNFKTDQLKIEDGNS